MLGTVFTDIRLQGQDLRKYPVVCREDFAGETARPVEDQGASETVSLAEAFLPW
jgi:hypothetical protein